MSCRHDAGARSLAVERCLCSSVATCWAASDGATSAYWVSTSTVAALQLEPHQAWRGSAARRYAKCCVGGAIAAGPANCTRVAQLLCPMVRSMRQEMVVPDRSSSETLSRVSTHTKSCSLQCQWSQVAGPPEQLAAVLARGTFAWRCRAHGLGSCAGCDSQVAHSSAGSSAGASAGSRRHQSSSEGVAPLSVGVAPLSAGVAPLSVGVAERARGRGEQRCSATPRG